MLNDKCARRTIDGKHPNEVYINKDLKQVMSSNTAKSRWLSVFMWFLS